MCKIIGLLLFLFSCNYIQAQIGLPSMRGVLNTEKRILTTMYSGGKGIGSSQKELIQKH